MRLGITLFDPYVAILDAKRFELATSDDAAAGLAGRRSPRSSPPRTASTSSRSARAPTAATAACHYRLHVGNFPRPTAVVPAGGKPGEALERPLPRRRRRARRRQTVTLPADAPTRLRHLRPGRRRAIAPSPNTFRLSTFGNVDRGRAERRPRQGDAVHRPAGAQRRHRRSRATSTTSSSRPRRGRSSTSTSTPAASARRSTRCCTSASEAAARIAGNDDAGGPDSYFRFTAPEDGEYVVWVHDHLGKGGPDYVYRVEVTPGRAAADARASPNESLVRRTGTIAVAVPKGNRQAMLVNASRADFGGELTIGAEGLPAGRDARGRPDGRRTSRRSGRVHRQGRRPRRRARWRRSPASRSTPS